ncbi:MAG: hypothetical protein LQ348_006196 [Seirophora lacunosa]|nr:MAG: hypothetical protein LQ348_006196 [Seirophora lacunosa]
MAKPPPSTSAAPRVTGIGMGFIHPNYFTRETWPLHDEKRLMQYRKFVQLMINRIRAGESTDEETERFATMFDNADHWPWMVPALAMLPELDEHGPYPSNRQMVTLLQHVEKVIDLSRQRRDEKAQRQPEESKPKEPKPLESAKEVTEEIRARLAKLLFGPDGEANASASMKRLLDSWVVMGYPEEVLQQALDNNKNEASKDLDRDNLGLPGELSKEHLFHLYKLEAEKRSASPRLEFPNSHMQFHMSSDDADDDSINDEPPPELTNTDDATAGSKEPTDSTDFWHSHKMHGDVYDRYSTNVSGAGLAIDPDVSRRRVNPPSIEITPQGMTIMKGFLNQPPSKSKAMLKVTFPAPIKVDEIPADQGCAKEVEKGATTFYEEAVMLHNRVNHLDEARRETQAAQEQQLAPLDEPSDDSFVVVTPRANTNPSTAGLPTKSGPPDQPTSSRHPQVARMGADENIRIDEVKKQLAALGMNVKGVNSVEPPQPMDPSLLKHSEKAERESSGAWTKEKTDD